LLLPAALLASALAGLGKWVLVLGAAEAALACFALAEIQQVRRAKRDRTRPEDRRPRPKAAGADAA
jgi:hypothetical protein